jgi:hypothetical protein
MNCLRVAEFESQDSFQNIGTLTQLPLLENDRRPTIFVLNLFTAYKFELIMDATIP